MSPKDKAKPSAPPDCPRQYHDDYIGRPLSRLSGRMLLTAAVVILVVCAVIFVVSQAIVA
jgi:hypothetical protein